MDEQTNQPALEILGTSNEIHAHPFIFFSQMWEASCTLDQLEKNLSTPHSTPSEDKGNFSGL